MNFKKGNTELLYCFLPQVLGHGGIPRFNRNLIQSLRDGNTLKIHSLNDSMSNEIIGHSGNKWTFLVAFLKAIIIRPKALIIGHLNFISITFFSWLFGSRSIIILHGYEAWKINGVKKIFSKFVSEFWAVSEYTAQQFQGQTNLSEKKIKKIFNTLPANWSRSSLDIFYEKNFLSVTRLDKEEGYKGIEETLNAVAKLQTLLRQEGWNYIVVAHGSDVERHIKLTQDLNIEDLVDFKSTVSEEDLKSLYAQCGFFLLPSTGEGFGIVFLEAMAYQKACIGAKNTGSEDVIEHHSTGQLINRNENEIATSIQFFIANPEVIKEFGEAGYRKLQDIFKFEHFKKRIAECVG